jgi:hypothetical protein
MVVKFIIRFINNTNRKKSQVFFAANRNSQRFFLSAIQKNEDKSLIPGAKKFRF